MTLFAKREGYLLVDHSASPGLSEMEALRAGYDPALCKEGKTYESATLTCSHCAVVVVKNPLRIRERTFCAKCGHHYICDICAAAMHKPDYDHTPFDKYVDTLRTQDSRGTATSMGSPSCLILPNH